jgi:hypothetical protein
MIDRVIFHEVSDRVAAAARARPAPAPILTGGGGQSRNCLGRGANVSDSRPLRMLQGQCFWVERHGPRKRLKQLYERRARIEIKDCWLV